MLKTLAIALFATLLTLTACSQQDQREADAKAAQARDKARHALDEAKADIHKANQDLSRAVNDNSGSQQTSAGQKLDHAGEIAKEKTAEAGRAIDHAALITKVKAKLAQDVGLNAATNVSVDVTGDVVTLRGTVPSPEKKGEAERAASRVSGVSRVVDQLTVQ